MKTIHYSIVTLLLILVISSYGQDTSVYKLMLKVPLADFPENSSLPNNFPSMNQTLEWSGSMYELGFMGIDILGDKIFRSNIKPNTPVRKISNHLFKYAIGLGFSKYGSELPIPLGVWAHEEFHRAVLGVRDVSSLNGNWLFSRWDGTVYGISDQTLEVLKTNNINQLLYSYTSGVQYEILLNQEISVNDFYFRRSLNKSSLLLYNAWYVYNYFRFSTSAASDSVKVLAPPHESSDPSERDYAGADLTAWIYDMFNPELEYTARDLFPEGEGVNRRIGFSDLSGEAQDYLVNQKKLSLLNFLNPAIFFINRIKISNNLSFNFFTQYVPTHFGNDIAVYLPVKYKKYDLLFNAHRYGNYSGNGIGIGLGLFNYRITPGITADLLLNAWNQPESFFENENITGGSFRITTRYSITSKISGYISVNAKSEGWIMGNPYLDSNIGVNLGLSYRLTDKLE